MKKTNRQGAKSAKGSFLLLLAIFASWRFVFLVSSYPLPGGEEAPVALSPVATWVPALGELTLTPGRATPRSRVDQGRPPFGIGARRGAVVRSSKR